MAVVATPSLAKPARAAESGEAAVSIATSQPNHTFSEVDQQIVIGTPSPLQTVSPTDADAAGADAVAVSAGDVDPATRADAAAEVAPSEAMTTSTDSSATATAAAPPPALGPTATPTDTPAPASTATATPTSTATPAAAATATPAVNATPTAPTVPVGYGRPGQIWSTMKPGYYEQTVFPVQGISTYYNPGVMDQVLEYRLRAGDITDCLECIGYIALVRAGDINRRVWMKMPDGSVEGPYLVADCAGRNHVARLLGIGWGVDVDWETAQRWEMKMRNVTLLDAPPAEWTQTIATIGERRATMAAATEEVAAASAPAATLAATAPATPAIEIEELPVHPFERPAQEDVPDSVPANLVATPATQVTNPISRQHQ